MINIDKDAMTNELRALISNFGELPRHIARKHLQAAMKRVIAPGIPILRSHTPPLGVGRGRKKKGQARSTGETRRSVTTKSKLDKDRNVYGVLGYRYGMGSMRSIFLEYGTPHITPRRMLDKTMSEFAGPSVAALTAEMAAALEKAANELAAGQNPGYGGK